MQQLAVDSPAAQLQSGWRPNHVIEAVSGRRYTFGAELNTRPREAEIRKAIEWAESGTPQAHGEFMRHILPMILIMDPDLPPPTRIRQSSVLSLDLEALFKAGREAEFKKVFEGLEQAKPEDWGEMIDLRFQELALRQYAPTATPAVKPSEPTTLAKPAAASSITRLSKRAKLQAKQVALKLKQAEKPGQTPPDVPGELDDMEPISFQEAARRLGKSVELVRGRFMKMPGVQRIPSPRKRGVRPYHTWAIPVPLFEAVKESWKVK